MKKKPIAKNSRNNTAEEKALRRMNRNIRAFLKQSMYSESFWEKWRSITLPARNADADLLQALFKNIDLLIHFLKKRDDKMLTAAIKDPLTGAYNRMYFNAFMEKTLKRADRYKENISIIMVDLDGFKGLNDQYGHQAGDAVLVETATLLGSAMRGVDLLFRYGGDEFLIVLPHANCDESASIQDRIQESVEEWNRSNTHYDNFRLSLSIGCSTWKRGDDLLSKIREADTMMYEKKRSTASAGRT